MPPRKPLAPHDKRSPRVVLAAELARLRTESGQSLRELAERVGWDHAHLHNMERGKSIGGPEAVEALDTFYGTTPFLTRLWELARQRATFREKYVRYMELESTATVIEGYDSATVPGLLQTEAYARALLWSTPHSPEDEPQLEEHLAARLSRQDLLWQPPYTHLRVILDEALLRRPLPDPDDWREQLAHLGNAASQPHVTLQVLPFAAGMHDLLSGTCIFLRLTNGRAVAWLESSKNGELVEDPEEVERFRLSYDAVRDLALSPRRSVAFLDQLMEDDPP